MENEHLFLDANAHLPLLLSIHGKSELSNLNNDIGKHGNPMSMNFAGRRASVIIENAREKIAEILKAKNSDNIVFTHSCTESNLWAAAILKKQIKQYEFVQASPWEHKSMDDALDYTKIYKIPVELNGDGNIHSMLKTANTVFIGVNNETGTITDLNAVRKSTTNLLISDMAQAVGRINIDLLNSSIDIATFGAHKFGGPIGVGIMYIKNPDLVIENFGTGNRYRSDIAGTPDVLGIYSTYLALSNAIDTMNERMEKAILFKSTLENGLEELGFTVICKNSKRIPTTSMFKSPIDSFNLIYMLSERYNIHIGIGSACGGVVIDESKIMKALGKTVQSCELIRISNNGEYGSEEAEFVVSAIKQIKER